MLPASSKLLVRSSSGCGVTTGFREARVDECSRSEETSTRSSLRLERVWAYRARMPHSQPLLPRRMGVDNFPGTIPLYHCARRSGCFANHTARGSFGIMAKTAGKGTQKIRTLSPTRLGYETNCERHDFVEPRLTNPYAVPGDGGTDIESNSQTTKATPTASRPPGGNLPDGSTKPLCHSVAKWTRLECPANGCSSIVVQPSKHCGTRRRAGGRSNSAHSNQKHFIKLFIHGRSFNTRESLLRKKENSCAVSKSNLIHVGAAKAGSVH